MCLIYNQYIKLKVMLKNNLISIETPKDVCVSLKDVTSSLSGLFLSEKPKSYRRIM